MISGTSVERLAVYLADIHCFMPEEVYLQKLSLIPSERRERIARCRNIDDRMRGLSAGLLLEYGLRKRGFTLLHDTEAWKRVHLAKGRYGKPYLSDCDNLHFNLSHAGDYVAAVFADGAAGIDIERVRREKYKIAKRFFSPEEYTYLMNSGECVSGAAGNPGKSRDFVFTRMWTRKESYIKAVGDGMHLPLDSFSVLSDVVEGAEPYFFHTWGQPEGYALSVCAKTPVNVQIQTVDLLKNI